MLVLAVAAGWAMALLGLPGNWLMVASAAAYAWFFPGEGPLSVSWATVISAVVLAILGEVAEMLASMWGAKKAGGSRRAALFSIFGSFVGAIAGAAFGIPIPVIGSAIAAVLGGALGALIGAAVAEKTKGESSQQSLRVGHAAFWGRLLGTGAKTFVATILAVLILVDLVL